MGIKINLDLLIVRQKLKSKDLAKKIGITEQNFSVLKSGRGKAIRFSTLNALCRHLNCQPGEILSYEEDAW